MDFLLLPITIALLMQAAPPAEFKVVDAGLHETEDGPGIERGTTYVPGESVYFSCRLDGFTETPEKKVAVAYTVTAVDPHGVALAEPDTGKVEVELSAHDKEWKPKIRYMVVVPPLAESGAYKIRVEAKDTLSGAAAEFEIPFEVRGHEVEPSDTLVVRNFRFYRSAEDSEPVNIAAYRPGDAVWARFDITGYKFGAQNKRDVAYTITVTADDGRVLLQPREPTADKGQSFYPSKYVPCTISMNLQPTIRPGEYTILIQAQDRIGDQTAEWKETFKIE